MKNLIIKIVLIAVLVLFAACDPSSDSSTDTPPPGGGGSTGGGGWPGSGGGGAHTPGTGHTHSGTWAAASTITLTDVTGFNVTETLTCSCGYVMDNRTRALDVFLAAQSPGTTLSFNVQMDLGDMTLPAGNWLTLLDYLENASPLVYANLDLRLSSVPPPFFDFDPVPSHSDGKNRVLELYLPNAATRIPFGFSTADATFQHFTNLNFVRGDWITHVGAFTFSYLSALSEINFMRATNIGPGAFWDVTTLTTVYLPLVQIIGASAFFNTGITGPLTLPNVQTIGSGAFAGASSLSTVTFGNNLDTIDSMAFAGTALTSINLPASFSSLGAVVFEGTTTLQTIYSRNPAAPWAAGDALFDFAGGVVLPSLTQIHIPAGSTGAYMAVAGWAAATGLLTDDL